MVNNEGRNPRLSWTWELEGAVEVDAQISRRGQRSGAEWSGEQWSASLRRRVAEALQGGTMRRDRDSSAIHPTTRPSTPASTTPPASTPVYACSSSHVLPCPALWREVEPFDPSICIYQHPSHSLSCPLCPTAPHTSQTRHPHDTHRPKSPERSCCTPVAAATPGLAAWPFILPGEQDTRLNPTGRDATRSCCLTHPRPDSLCRLCTVERSGRGLHDGDTHTHTHQWRHGHSWGWRLIWRDTQSADDVLETGNWKHQRLGSGSTVM